MRYTFIAQTLSPLADPRFDIGVVPEAEASLVLLTRELSRRRRAVEVFAPNQVEGAFHQVKYRGLSRFDGENRCDILVSVGTPSEEFVKARARLKVLWCIGFDAAQMRNMDLHVHRIVFPSAFHQPAGAGVLAGSSHVLGKAIATGHYFREDPDDLPLKQQRTLVLNGTPKSNVVQLGRLLVQIRLKVPDCQLIIPVNETDNSGPVDDKLWADEASQYGILCSETPNRNELVALQRSAAGMIAPTDCLAESGLFALECLAAGTPAIVPDTTDFRSALGEHGVFVDRKLGQEEFEQRFIAATVELLQEDDSRRQMAKKGRQYAYQEHRIEVIANRFEEVIALPEPAITVTSGATVVSSIQSVAVIIPVYNQARDLRTAVASVACQLGSRDELIVVDDASTDTQHFEALKPFRDRILWLSNTTRSGVSNARNRGIERSRAQWIKFLDADDILAPCALEVIRQAAAQVPAFIQVVAGGYHRLRNGRYYDYCNDGVTRFQNIYKENPLPASAALVRRSTLLAIGMFDERIDFEEDWDLWLRLHERYGEDAFGVIQTPVCYVRDSHAEKHQRPRKYTVDGLPVRDYFQIKYGVES